MAIVDAIYWVLTLAIIARVILSFVAPMAGPRPSPLLVSIQRMVFQVTEPVLGPIRRYTTFGAFDFSPMVALIVLALIRGVLDSKL